MKIEFKKANVNDLQMIRDWIKSNTFVQKWYYKNRIPRISTLDRIIIKRQSRKNFYANIILIDGKPIGYIQSYDIEGWGSWSKQVKVYDKTVGLDYFIGDINYIHKGYGEKFILEYINLIKKSNKYDFVMISPDPLNVVNRKCIEKCGFEFVKIVNTPKPISKYQEAIYLKKI